MNDSDNIKALIPVVCPHCEKTLVVEFLIGANLLGTEEAAKVLGEAPPVPPPTTPEPPKPAPDEEE